MEVTGNLYIAEERAVDTETHARHRFRRLDVDVGGLFAHSLLKNTVHKTHDGRGVGGDIRDVLRRRL